MSGIITLGRVELRLLTPMFIAGADQNVPELRASAIKSALRFWYRAVDPRAVFSERKGDPRNEDFFFGGGGEKAAQSRVLLRITTQDRPTFQWNQNMLRQFDEGSGTHRKNGLRYLSFSLHMSPNDQRKALAPGLAGSLTLLAERKRFEKLPERGRRAWVAALWLLGNLGALGTRSRRGLGGLEITNWSSWAQDELFVAEAAQLPDLGDAQGPQDWNSGFQAALEVFDRWFGTFGAGECAHYQFLHPHLGGDMGAALLTGGFPRWEEALNSAGRKLQNFRVRKAPDYDHVKKALANRRAVARAPERAAFGLPLTFRYSSQPGPAADFVPTRQGNKQPTRHASPLLVRLARIGERYHPLFVRMSGAVPGVDPPADMLTRDRGRLDRHEGLGPARAEILADFMKELGRSR